MGVVYKARHLRLNRLVALKMIRAGSGASPEMVERFRTEAEAIARLRHPNIIQIYEVGETGGQSFLALEFVAGGSLATRLAAAPLPPREAVALTETLARAVHAAHQQGVIHRDLKPANVLLTADGTPKITDFGVAKLVGADQAGQTETGVIIGTPSYMAPEQASGKSKEVSAAVDIYALGAILYEMLTGRPPFRGATSLDTLDQVRTQEPVPPSRLQPRTPRDLETICLKCLYKDPARRYASAEALADDCAAFLQARPIQARPARPLYHFGKFAQRNKALVSAAVILFLALTGASWLGALIVIQRDRADLAEKEKVRLQADGYVQAARLAAQRGQWRTALAHFEKALETGYGDAVGLRLEKVRASVAINDIPRARSELETIAGLPDLGEHEGSVLLLQADLLLYEDYTKAERILRLALEKELPPGGKAYAEALLAESTPEAITQLKRSLAQDPYQPRARTILELLLILLARLPEASSALTEHEALFPEDPNAKVLRACVIALADDNQPPASKQAAANRVLEGLRGQVQDSDVRALQAVVKLLSVLKDPNNPIDEVTGLPILLPHLMDLAPVFPLLWHLPAEAGSKDVIAAFPDLIQNFPLHPLVRKVGVRFLHAVEEANKALPVPVKALEEMDWAASIHPEGFVLYMRAMVLFAVTSLELVAYNLTKNPEQLCPLAGRLLAVEQAALEAADTPALLPVRRPALRIATSAEAMLYTLSQEPDFLHQAIVNIRKDREQGPIRIANHRQVAVSCAVLAKDYNLARQLLDDWEQQDPTDLEAARIRAKIEMKAEAYGSALKAAEKVLQQKPDDPEMLKLKDDAVKKLREQLQAFPDKPAP
jgi:tetratricopeptide (TPR) repeat protein